jgi:uncharacterized membrane protein HdeD (DUF308 family)
VLTLVVGIWAIVAGVSEITAAWLPRPYAGSITGI